MIEREGVAGGGGVSRQGELIRKVIHTTATLAAACTLLADPFQLGRAALTAGTAIAIAVEVARRRSRRTERIFMGLFGRMLREDEEDRLTGATTLAIGTLAAAYTAPPAIAAAGVIMAGIGDAAGAVAGRTLGRTRMPNGKSLEGAIACLLAASLAATPFQGVTLGMAATAAIVIATLEAANARIDDNLFLPFVATLTLRLTALLG